MSSAHDDVVDGDVDELDKKSDEAHHQEPNRSRLSNLHELCRQAEGKNREDG